MNQQRAAPERCSAGVGDRRKKRGSPVEEPPINITGDDLLSHTAAGAVSSALKVFTSVFGMGTGVTPSLKPPVNLFAGEREISFPTSILKMNKFQVKPHDRLVLVSCIRCRTSTSSLSTS